MKKYLFVGFLALIFLSITVKSQSAGKILKQATNALGAEKSLREINSFQKKGTIVRLKDAARGAFFEQGAEPNLYNVIYDLNGFESESGFNGKSGWTRDSRDGLRTLTGDLSRDFQSAASFRNNLWLNYKKEKAKIAAGALTNIDGKPANVLIYTTAKGLSVKLFFDRSSNLLLREERRFGNDLKTFDYADYRKIDGVSEAFFVKEKFGEEVYEIRFEQILHNRQIARSEFDFPKISGEPIADIPALLASLQTNEDRIEAILDDYSFTQKITGRELGKDGSFRETESQTVQLSFYKGNRLRRVVEKNGKPLSAEQQADEDKNVEKRVAEIDKEIAKKEARAAAVQTTAKAVEAEDNNRISIAELLRASNLVNPRRERFRDREVVVFDFEPNPNFDYKNAKSFLKFFGKTAGVMWIDAQDKQVVRLEAVLADNFKIGGGLVANLKKGASFALEQERVNDEIWLPSLADVNLSAKVLLVKAINVNQTVKSYNYRKFTTEVKDSKIDEIKQP